MIKNYKEINKNNTNRYFTINHVIPQINEITNGINDYETIVVAARPGCGKTSLLLNVALSCNIDGGKTLFFSCEMRAEELCSRLGNTLTASNETRFNEELFLIDDSNNISVSHIEKTIKKLKPSVVFIDYIQLLSGNIKENSKQLKMIARKYRVPIFIAAQLNRQAANKEPELYMIKDCGGIEQDADEVWFIMEDWIKVAKNRKGPTGKLPIIFDKKNSGLFLWRWYEINETKPKQEQSIYVESIFDKWTPNSWKHRN